MKNKDVYMPRKADGTIAATGEITEYKHFHREEFTHDETANIISKSAKILREHLKMVDSENDTPRDQLPAELSSQLRKPRKFQIEVTKILEESKGGLTTDEILVKLYQKFNILAKRASLKTQLWHLSEAGIIVSKHYADYYSLPTPKKG